MAQKEIISEFSEPAQTVKKGKFVIMVYFPFSTQSMNFLCHDLKGFIFFQKEAGEQGPGSNYIWTIAPLPSFASAGE